MCSQWENIMATQFEGPHKKSSNSLPSNRSSAPLMSNEFKLSNKDFQPSKKPDKLQPERTGRFLATSVLIHGLFVLIAFAASLEMFEDKKNEPVEIELLSSGPATTTEATTPAAPAPVVAAAPTKAAEDDVVLPAKPVAAMAKPVTPAPVPKASKPVAKATPAPRQTQPTIAPVKVAAAKVQTYQTESPVVLPESVDDIQAPQLAEATTAPINPNEINDDEDLKKDFAKVDHHQKKQVLALAQDLDAQNKEALSETEKAADQAAQENEVDGEKIAAFNASQRARDAQAIAAADAGERAAAAKAALLAKEARAAQAANAAAAAAAAEAAQKKAEQESAGNGAGIPTGIRDAQDLRQRPGNPLPRYDQNERLLGHQGNVVFLAYVTPEGVPTQFRLSASTGFKNLDGKTLKALKQWRFYPGQEGWVEMTFNWNLKGGPQEMPGLLKRK